MSRALAVPLGLLTVLLAASLAGCTSSPSIEDLSPSVWRDQAETTPDAFILDVRSASEHADGHIAGTHANIEYTTIEANQDQLPDDKDTPIFIYCRSDRRSGIAADTLADLGYTDIRDLDGGIVAWQEAGYPLV